MFKYEDLIKAIPQIKIIQRGLYNSFSSASIDSRKIEVGQLFFAIKGRNRDGHDYIENALRSGGYGAVVSKNISVENPRSVIIKTNNTLTALKKLAAWISRKYKTKIIAVTGSVGKTTTKDMIAHLLSQQFSTVKSVASFNNQYGVPLTILNIKPSHTHAVIEMGTNHKGEIKQLTAIARPDIGIITNIGYAHIEKFKSREAILREKMELLYSIKKGGLAILNGDDPYLKKILPDLKKKEIRTVTIGFSKSNDIYVKDIIAGRYHISGCVVAGRGKIPFSINAVGEHFVYSALIAIGVSSYFGQDIELACKKMESFSFPAGRLNIYKAKPNIQIIDDSYNASPDAVSAALRTLGKFNPTLRIAILGEMRELGDYSEPCHKKVGKLAASVASYIIAVGPAGPVISKAAIDYGFNKEKIIVAESATEALEILTEILSSLKEEVVILVKGSRFTHMERIVLGLSGTKSRCQLPICSMYINCNECEKRGSNGRTKRISN